ncbi:hypothetical protein F2Q70_00034830 [Brassica cretica]|uniref:Uncharacterized protein n=1 Tax=Brassica cretica TaxID=69181 RepID=A0A8S9JUT3_BRACR|nr:hypothetical protein F2Q70_00034830 [Brassica cretica]
MPEYGRRQENQSSSRQDQQFTRCDQVAISTFLLSRRWRHIWCDIPSLTLDVDTLIAASVNETLIHYTDPKTKNLYLKATKREDIPHIDRWIKCAMPHNVENLSLDFSRKPQRFIKFNILGSSNPTAATTNVETAVFISRGGEEASMDDESDLLHMQMAHLPLRLRLRRCVSELSLSDESPMRREKLTEGFNLKPVSFMAQFHSSRPDCNLYAFWVRKFTEESNSIILSTRGRLNKLKTLAIVLWLRHGDGVVCVKASAFHFWFIVFRRLEGNELDGMSFSDRVVGFNFYVYRAEITVSVNVKQKETMVIVKLPFNRDTFIFIIPFLHFFFFFFFFIFFFFLYFLFLLDIIFHSIDPLALINPFAVDVYSFTESCDSSAKAFFTDSTSGNTNHLLHTNLAFDTRAVIAKRTAKDSMKFTEESNSIILSTRGRLNKLKTLAIVLWLRHGDDVVCVKASAFHFWFIVFRRLEGNELDGMSFSDRVVGFNFYVYRAEITVSVNVTQKETMVIDNNECQ